MRRVEGEVEQIQCSVCAACCPTFVFSGDTDMATAGLEAATLVEPPFVVIGTLNAEELKAEYSEGREKFANRIGHRLGQELVALSVTRWIHGPSSQGMTFQQFREVYRPSEPIYRCPKCGGDAAVSARHTPADFVAQGGRLELTEDITL